MDWRDEEESEIEVLEVRVGSHRDGGGMILEWSLERSKLH